MDPIGLALENFDADAKWRARHGGNGGAPIDASAELWDGSKVNGPAELRERLLAYSPQFVRTITEKMMTFAIGRGVEHTDMPVVRSIARNAGKNDSKLSAILIGIIESGPFQMRTKTTENGN
jgi:hypothetical protein